MHNGILLGHKKEFIWVSSSEVDEPRACYAKWSKQKEKNKCCILGLTHTYGTSCIPHPNLPSHLPLHPIPLGLPSTPGPSTCLMHPTWAGDLVVMPPLSFIILVCRARIETQTLRTGFGHSGGRRVWQIERITLKHIHYHM